jgi:protein-tyrosine kinase
MIRTNFAWTSLGGEHRSILITSGMQGEGKSFTLCNLAVVLAFAGKKVVVVDADLRAPRVHTLFSTANRVGLTSVVAGSASLSEALVPITLDRHDRVRVVAPERLGESPRRSSSVAGRLSVLPAGPLPPNPGEVVASAAVTQILATLAADDVDFVLVDTPPVLPFGDTGALAAAVDGLLFVVDLKRATRPVLVECREALDPLPCRKLGLVVIGDKQEPTSSYSYARSSV